jgi:hypothetical protein
VKGATSSADTAVRFKISLAACWAANPRSSRSGRYIWSMRAEEGGEERTVAVAGELSVRNLALLVLV